MGKRMLLAIIGPMGIAPIAFLVAWWAAAVNYTPPEASLKPEAMLFLQGSTDLGGGTLFAATMVLYVVFGVLAAIYLTFKLDERPAAGFRRNFVRALALLKWHVLAFVVGGMANLSYDALVLENDFRNMFRNMFLLAALTYALWVARWFPCDRFG